MSQYKFKLKENTPQSVNEIIKSLRQRDGPKFEMKLHWNPRQQILFVAENTVTDYLQIYNYMQEWTIKKYEVPSVLGRNPTILKIISGIEFPKLLYLNLVNMKINNIEPVIWMDCPELKQLQLRHNNIVSFKPMLKGYFPNLKKLDLQYNPGTMRVMSPQIDQLGRIYNFNIRNNKYYLLYNRK